MRTDKDAKEAREATPGLQVFAPGETVPTPYTPAGERSFEPARHPLDTPPRPPIRQVGRRVIECGK
jgi:hypothetical protein